MGPLTACEFGNAARLHQALKNIETMKKAGKLEFRPKQGRTG